MSGPFVEALVNPVTLSATTTHLSDSPLLGPPRSLLHQPVYLTSCFCVISVYLISFSSERKRLFELVCLAIAPELFGLNQRKCGQAEGKRRASLQGSLGGPAVPSIFL